MQNLAALALTRELQLVEARFVSDLRLSLNKARRGAANSTTLAGRPRAMTEFLSASLSFPAVLFTALLGLMLIYWILVVVGAVGLDLLGGGHHELDLEHSFDGHAFDGAHAVDGHPGGGEVEAPSAFSLRQVPVTVWLSLLCFWGWLLTHLGSHYLLPQVAFPRIVSGSALLLVASGLAFALTKLSIRPLVPLFRTHEATRRRDLVGRIVTVRTGRVDRKYGQALLDDDSNALLLEVRCEPERGLERGQRVMIISVDEAAEAYEVEPVDDFLSTREPPRERR